MKQVIEWKEIEWDNYNKVRNVPHQTTCYFLFGRFDDEPNGQIYTGYYLCYDEKWVVIGTTTVKISLQEFTHYAEVV